MNKIFLVGMILFSAMSSYAQNGEVSYAYDQAGNRIQRVTLVVGGNRVADTVTSLKSDYSFKLYPNVTEGVLYIEADEKFLDLQNREYSVYDANGKIVASGNFINPKEEINLSHCVQGVYIVKLTADGGYGADWRIVKR